MKGMIIFRITFALVAPLLVLSSACGDEESESEDVLWSCTCAAECDGTSASETSQGCGSASDASEAVNETTSACQDELADVCEEYSCSCECTPSDEACEQI